MTNESDMLTVDEVAAELKVSPWTVREHYIKPKHLKAFRIGVRKGEKRDTRQYRVWRDDLIDFLERNSGGIENES